MKWLRYLWIPAAAGLLLCTFLLPSYLLRRQDALLSGKTVARSVEPLQFQADTAADSADTSAEINALVSRLLVLQYDPTSLSWADASADYGSYDDLCALFQQQLTLLYTCGIIGAVPLDHWNNSHDIHFEYCSLSCGSLGTCIFVSASISMDGDYESYLLDIQSGKILLVCLNGSSSVVNFWEDSRIFDHYDLALGNYLGVTPDASATSGEDFAALADEAWNGTLSRLDTKLDFTSEAGDACPCQLSLSNSGILVSWIPF